MSAPVRGLEHLHPVMRPRVDALMGAVEAEGLPFRVYETARRRARQEAGRASGRSGAGYWRSRHQYGLAVDLVGRVDGRWTWDESLPWERLGDLVSAHGLAWGGDWPSLRDRPHVEYEWPLLHALDPRHVGWPYCRWADWAALWVDTLVDWSEPSDVRRATCAAQAAMSVALGRVVAVDGVAGPQTLGALSECTGGPVEVWSLSAVHRALRLARVAPLWAGGVP